jgi:hypothetical protein
MSISKYSTRNKLRLLHARVKDPEVANCILNTLVATTPAKPKKIIVRPALKGRPRRHFISVVK